MIAALGEVVHELQDVELSALTDRELLEAVRDLEVVRRRLDHATGRLIGQVDATGAFREDGHRTAKSAVTHLGRLPSAEAHARVRTARVLHRLPEVARGYADGTIPTPSVRAIVRVASNPRVVEFLYDADPLFAAMAATEPYDDLVRWLAEWEALADADGAEQQSEMTHRRRQASLRQQPDGSWHLRARLGALQGAAMARILAAYETAEWEADRAEAVAEHGDDATIAQFPRTPEQRRADALLQIFRRAGASEARATSPEPLVDIVIDQETFEDELRRMAGQRVAADPGRAGKRLCQTTDGHRVHPTDAVAAALVGHVRRVVVGASSTVIDLGRKRRLFTGSSRDAAVLQAILRARGRAGCLWHGCDSPPSRLQVDHDRPWHDFGRTDIANSTRPCGHHNRLKERGFRPIRGPDGRYTILRPDGSPITPSA